MQATLIKHFVAILLVSPSLVLISCSRKAADNGLIKIQIPANPLASQKNTLSTSSIDYNLLCIGLNVKGGNIAAKKRDCDIERGLIVGAVKPGEELSMSLNNGSVYNFELYGFLRSKATDECPQLGDAPVNWPSDKIYFLGDAKNIKINPPETRVDIPFKIPDAAQNIGVQMGWPAACLATSNPDASKRLGRVLIANGQLTGAAFSIRGQVSYKQEQGQLKGSIFSIQNGQASYK